MKATVTLKSWDGKFRIKIIDETTGRPPNSLREFYNEPYEVEDALEKLGLDRDQRAYMMLISMGGEAALSGINLPDLG
jgi:hypothetical protein